MHDLELVNHGPGSNLGRIRHYVRRNEGIVHFIRRDNVKTYTARLGGYEEDKHLGIIIELIHRFGTSSQPDHGSGYVQQGA
jgi:hypothetical protein